MASYVEQATLRVNDQSSRKIKSIDRALKSLFATAKGARSGMIGPRVDGRSLASINKATAALRRLKSAQNQIQKTSVSAAVTSARRSVPSVPQSTGNQPISLPDPRRYGSAMGGTFLTTVRFTLAAAITSAITEGFKKGASDADIAGTRESQLNLSSAEKLRVAAKSSSIRDQSGTLNTNQIRRMILEMIPQTDGDIDLAGDISAELIRVVKDRIKAGASREGSVEGAIDLFKMGASSGNFIENGSEDIKIHRVKRFFDLLRATAAFQGKDFDPAKSRQVMANANIAKFGLGDRGLASLMIRSEELNTRAATSLNQMLKLLQGGSTKTSINKLAEMGLIKTREDTIATIGGKKKKVKVADGMVDGELAVQDMLSWLMKNFIPALKKQNVDPNNISEVSQFLNNNKMGRATARSGIAEMVSQAAQHNREVTSLMRLVEGARVQEKESDESSSLLAVADAMNQFEGALGNAANALEGPFISAMTGVSSALKGFQDLAAGKDGQGNAPAVIATAIGAALTTYLAAKGAKRALGIGKMTLAANEHMVAARALQSAARALGGGKTGGKSGKKGKSKTGASSDGFFGSSIAMLIATASELSGAKSLYDKHIGGAFESLLTKAGLNYKQKEVDRQNNSSDQALIRKAKQWAYYQDMMASDGSPGKDHLLGGADAQNSKLAQALESVKTELAHVNASIARNSGGRSPIIANALNAPLNEEKTSLQQEITAIQAQITNAQGTAATFQQAANTGDQAATNIQAAGNQMQSVPGNISTAMVEAARQGAGLLSNAIQSATANVNVNINQSVNKNPNTGNMAVGANP